MDNRIKLFSLNLWNLNNNFKSRMQVVNSWIIKTLPDIVFFQEVSPDPVSGRYQSDLIYTTNPSINRVYASQYQWDNREEGLCILTRFPVIATESMILPAADHDGQRRLLIAVLEVDGKHVLAANTHLAFRIDQDTSRLRQSRHLLNCIKSASEFYKTSNIILAGDFNAIPTSPAVTEITQSDLRLNDIFCGSDERNHQFTFSTMNPYVNVDYDADRWIDYMFVSDDFAVEKCSLSLNGLAGSTVSSDHFALEATVEFLEK